jgi:O-antigen ligase
MKTITPNVAGAVEGSEDEELDQSAQSRVHFWRVAVRMAADRPFLGVGFLRFAQAYPQYDTLEGSYGRHRAVHSAWFAALAETGVVGFLWFGSMLVGAIVSCWRVRRLAQHNPDLAELSTFAAGLNTAFMTFIVGATFVTLTYSDLLWHMMTLAFLLHRIAKAEVAAAAAVRPAGAAAAVEQAIQLAAPFSDRPRIAASR